MGRSAVSLGTTNKIGLSAIFAGVAGFITFIYETIISGLGKITDYMAEIVATTFPAIEYSQIVNILSLCNAIYPLSETITIFSSLYVFWGVVILLRWIKSFVPTIAN